MTKTDLSQVYCLRIEIELLQKQIDGLPQNISNTVDSVKGSSPCFPYVEHTIKIEGVDMVGYENKARALEKKLEARKTELIQKADEINDFIVSVPDSELRTILTLRYINCMSWQQVAIKMGMEGDGSTERKKHDRFLKFNN
jgi:hypothetical protein